MPILLDGGAGDDTIGGGDGNDQSDGGPDKDTFFFDTALNAASNVDKIADFSVGDYTVRLENATFAALATGTLAAGPSISARRPTMPATASSTTRRPAR